MGDRNVSREEIERNLRDLRGRIAEACDRAGRDPAGIRLIAVSKGQPADVVRLAYDLGLRDFGENRVEEALPKQAQLHDLPAVVWHMVGHVQSRKAGRVAESFACVHSVDSLKLARHLDRFSREGRGRLPILLECNVSGEGAKYGWPTSDRGHWREIASSFAEIQSLPGLEIQGLMTMAPFGGDERILREVFRKLRELRDWLVPEMPQSMKELSMGMTDDFELAIEEGTTMIRIGRAIFGERHT
jgi:pyridoxal phosphate enzyme (YggS family)